MDDIGLHKVIIYGNERLDDLHRSGYMIIQDPKRFCFGIDAVLLSSFAKAGKNDRVLDLGTGTGAIPILMEAKTRACYFEGIEIQPEVAGMAARSVSLNKLDDKIKITLGDIRDIKNTVKAASFDVVTSNPPYMISGGGLVGEHPSRAVARHELTVSLDGIVFAAAYALRFKGRFFMVHRPFRLADIICTLRKYRLEPKTIRFVQPYADKEPNMVLVEAVMGGSPQVNVMNALVVYDKNGEYTKECYDIYYG